MANNLTNLHQPKKKLRNRTDTSNKGPTTNPGLSLPMNNFGVAAAPQFQMGQSNLPIRTAPVPPAPTIVNSNVVPQIMVTQDQDFSIFEGKHCWICIVVIKICTDWTVEVCMQCLKLW